MLASSKYHVRRIAWIFAASGLLVYVMFQLSSDGVIDSEARKKSVGGPFDEQPFREIIVHLDLKGAPPIVPVYEWLFPLLKSMGVKGVLMEYEDMFPYSGELAKVSRTSHYNRSDIYEINRVASANNLEIIPLVQTFGHMEFILKYSHFAHLRENPLADDTICPSDARSIELIRNVIDQVRALHPKSDRIHIGADEAYHIAEDDRCRNRLSQLGETDERRAVEKLKLTHIAKVARLARDSGFKEVFAWNDMFDKSLVEDIREAGLGDLITPVVWGYKVDVTAEGYFPANLFQRLSRVFSKVYFASAFKGALTKDEKYITTDRYLRNHMSYVKLYRENKEDLDGRVGGIIVTGWQRYMHHAPLCELLMISIPSLVSDLVYLDNVTRDRNEMWKRTREVLRCPQRMDPTLLPVVFGSQPYLPHKDAFLKVCSFKGHELFKLVMEDLHVLEWKIERFKLWRNMTSPLNTEVDELAVKLSKELKKYYFAEDISEFLRTKVLSQKEKLVRRELDDQSGVSVQMGHS